MLKLYFPLLITCLVFLTQCQKDEGIVPDLSGEWFYSGDTISFSWNLGRTKKDDIVTSSIEQRGQLIYTENFYDSDNISLSIPNECRSGVLNISSQLPSNDDKKVMTQVYYLEKPYGPISLSYFPPVPMVGSIVEASCTVEDISDDTWFRWSLEDQLIWEGYRKDGGERISFFGPRKRGSYTLELELFPGPIISDRDITPHSETMEIFFNETADSDGKLNSDNWQSLFFCDGTNTDRGRSYIGQSSEKALAFVAGNDLTPQVVGGDRGYGFTSESFLKYDGKILQGQGSTHALIQARMILYPPLGGEPEDKTVQIFSSKDGKGLYSYSLFMKEGNLLFSLGQNDKYVRSLLEFPSLLEGIPFWLSLVVEQKEENLLIRWYLNYILMKEEKFESFILPQVFSGGGNTIWGRENYHSFEGVLLEWGFNGEPGEVKRFEKEMNYEYR
jgi:hypothetical protein